jgi:hypothetical protein
MGMPPVRSRTSSAKSLICEGWSIRETRRRDGVLAFSSPRTSAILPVHLVPGRWPPVPVLAPCPPLKWKAWTLVQLVPGKAEARRGQLVEVARIGLLLLGQHAALAGANARAGQFRAAWRGRFSPLRTARRSSCRRRRAGCRAQRLLRIRADHHIRCRPDRRRAAAAVQLGGQDLEIVPAGSSSRGTPMASTLPWWPVLDRPSRA